MNTRVTCPCCRAPIMVDRATLGRGVVCPRTGKRFAVGPRNPSSRRRRDASRRRTALVAGAVLAVVAVGFAGHRLARRVAPRPAPSVEVAAAPVAVPVVPPPAPVKPVAPTVATAPPPRAVEAIAVAPPPRAVVPKVPTPAERMRVVHALPLTLDLQTADDTERDLLAVREVSLDDATAPASAPRPSAAVLGQYRSRKDAARVEPPVVLACKVRPDLAGLPFRVGAGAVAPRDRAESMNALAPRLRTAVRASGCNNPDRRPDPETLLAKLTVSEGTAAAWASPSAVPCVRQMLAVEGGPVRRMGCELLRDVPSGAATETLVSWAVFDTDPANRAAAVDALKGRDKPTVARLLAPHFRYPWPRAVEHACEAAAALDLQPAVPTLAAAHTQPDPDAPFAVDLPGEGRATFRREVVRLDHVRNCLLCHPPSFASADLIRGAIPDLDRPEQSSGYGGGPASQFVTAGVTFLRQDFSVVQPATVVGHGAPRRRYDYLVAVRRDDGLAAVAPSADSPYRRAVGAALRVLTGRDPDAHGGWVRRQAAGGDDGRVGEAARATVLAATPAAFLAVTKQEFGRRPTRMSASELGGWAGGLQKAHGGPAARLALTAHLDPLTRDPDPATAGRAAKLLAAVRELGPTEDVGTALAVTVRQVD